MLKRIFIAMAFVTALTVLPAGANYAYASTNAPAKPANQISGKALLSLDGKTELKIDYKRNITGALDFTVGGSFSSKGDVKAGVGFAYSW